MIGCVRYSSVPYEFLSGVCSDSIRRSVQIRSVHGIGVAKDVHHCRRTILRNDRGTRGRESGVEDRSNTGTIIGTTSSQEILDVSITASEARKNLFPSHRAWSIENREPIEITSKRGDAVLMSRADYDALNETALLLRSPANARRLLKSLELQANAGERSARQALVVASWFSRPSAGEDYLYWTVNTTRQCSERLNHDFLNASTRNPSEGIGHRSRATPTIVLAGSTGRGRYLMSEHTADVSRRWRGHRDCSRVEIPLRENDPEQD